MTDKTTQQERLAAALRENLKKRKEQGRARETTGDNSKKTPPET